MEGVDLGTVGLDETLTGAVVITNGSREPKDPTVLPTYRVYGVGPSTMANGQGNLSKLDTGTITNATNATPIVITSAGHNLQTGTKVTVSGVLGNTAANGDFTVTWIDADTFSLDSSVGNGAYTSGGAWHVTGLYTVSFAASEGNGYEAGLTYSILVSWSVSGTPYSTTCTFQVV
jgi:hypothetical protein